MSHPSFVCPHTVYTEVKGVIHPMEEYKPLMVGKEEAEMIMDSFKVTNPLTRELALRAADLVLEFAAEQKISEATRLVAPCAT